MRVYLCGDTAHDPGLNEEHGHAECEPRKRGRVARGPNRGLGWEILYDHYVKLGFKHDKEIKVSQKKSSVHTW